MLLLYNCFSRSHSSFQRLKGVISGSITHFPIKNHKKTEYCHRHQSHSYVVNIHAMGRAEHYFRLKAQLTNGELLAGSRYRWQARLQSFISFQLKEYSVVLRGRHVVIDDISSVWFAQRYSRYTDKAAVYLKRSAKLALSLGHGQVITST